MPPKPIRTLRNLTRYRKSQIGERQREANRLHKILEDTGISFDCVASDIPASQAGRCSTRSARARPTRRCWPTWPRAGRKKIPALQEALEGRFSSEHALVVSAILAHLDFLDEQIAMLSDAIEEQLRPFAAAVRLLVHDPGVKRRTAEVIIAEIGTDMTVFLDRRGISSAGPDWGPATTSPPANAAPTLRNCC